MPTILRWNGYRFYFFSNEGFEPPHIHIDRDNLSAKFWLEPVELAKNYGFPEYEIRILLSKISEEKAIFLKAWYDYF